MNKTYNQKENIYIYVLLLLVFVALYIWAVWLVNYHLYVLIVPAIIFILKIIKIKKNPEVPVIKLTDTEIHCLIFNKTFKYSEISHIHLNSKLFNGYLILKGVRKKEILNSVALTTNDQKEIREFITSKIEA